MSNTTLILVIAAGTFVIVTVSVVGFIAFSRFLKREEQAGKIFREIHRKPKD